MRLPRPPWRRGASHALPCVVRSCDLSSRQLSTGRAGAIQCLARTSSQCVEREAHHVTLLLRILQWPQRLTQGLQGWHRLHQPASPRLCSRLLPFSPLTLCSQLLASTGPTRSVLSLGPLHRLLSLPRKLLPPIPTRFTPVTRFRSLWTRPVLTIL